MPPRVEGMLQEKDKMNMRRIALVLALSSFVCSSGKAQGCYAATNSAGTFGVPIPPSITRTIAYSPLPDGSASLVLSTNAPIEINWFTEGGACFGVKPANVADCTTWTCPGLRGAFTYLGEDGNLSGRTGFLFHFDTPGATQLNSFYLDTCLDQTTTYSQIWNYQDIEPGGLAHPSIFLSYPTPGPKFVKITLYLCNGVGNLAASTGIIGAQVTVPLYIGATLEDPPLNSRKNGAIVGNPVALATTSSVVQGVAADGVTQTMVVIPSTTPGQSFTVSLQNDRGLPGDPYQDGALGQFGATSSQINQSSVTVTADNNSSGPHFAVATYLAPIDFVRGAPEAYKGTCALQTDYDENLPCRTVTINVAASIPSNQQPITIPVLIVRPPVMLIHGLWANASAWNQFSPLYSSSGSDSRFAISLPHFGAANDSVSVYSSYIQPALATWASSYPTVSVSRNALGFAYNSEYVLSQIRTAFTGFRSGKNPIGAPVAVTQADIVGHSLGGNIARFMATESSYLDDASFRQGVIHKLITIDTPHLGSPLATDLLQPANACTANVLSGSLGLPVIGQALTTDGRSIPGAIGDLQDATNAVTFVSQGLANINNFTGPPQISTAFIGGNANATNYASLPSPALTAILFVYGCSNNPLYADMTPTNWTASVFSNYANDAIVAVYSQVFNAQLKGVSISNSQVVDLGNAATVFPGLVHSLGTVGVLGLGFTGPSVINSAQVANQVIQLLNTPVSNATSFQVIQ